MWCDDLRNILSGNTECYHSWGRHTAKSQHHQRPGTILPGKDIFQQDNVFYHIAQADCCKYFQECEENLILLHW